MTLTDPEPEIVRTDGGSCALWWRGQIPSLPGERLGVIGRYACEHDPADLLERACARLRAEGCTRAVGPMDGNTWRTYRFVTDDPSGEPPFFLEPANPPEYPLQWRDAGFTPLATYRSTVADDLTVADPRAPRIAARMEAAGVTLRPVDLTRAEEDLDAIYALSLVSFARNVLYTPLERDAFLAQYRRLLPAVDPALTVLAHAPGGALVGFCFALPDLAQAQRGEPVRTMIVKTAAVRPGRAWAGLGVHLLERCQAVARERGYTRAIHALMEDGNTSRTISEAHGARTLRRYTLFAKRLAP